MVAQDADGQSDVIEAEQPGIVHAPIEHFARRDVVLMCE